MQQWDVLGLFVCASVCDWCAVGMYKRFIARMSNWCGPVWVIFRTKTCTHTQARVHCNSIEKWWCVWHTTPYSTHISYYRCNKLKPNERKKKKIYWFAGMRSWPMDRFTKWSMIMSLMFAFDSVWYITRIRSVGGQIEDRNDAPARLDESNQICVFLGNKWILRWKIECYLWRLNRLIFNSVAGKSMYGSCPSWTSR